MKSPYICISLQEGKDLSSCLGTVIRVFEGVNETLGSEVLSACILQAKHTKELIDLKIFVEEEEDVSD